MFKNRVIKRIVDKVHKRIGDPPTPHPDLNYMVMDPDFIFRGCPNDLEQGHDQLGYRNENIPNKIEHLFVGDSQVYGTSVNANQTFPYLLKHAMKREVYNGSCGGYGPFQYALVVDELLPLNPKHVTLFIYNGNDLSDATRAAIMSESSLADLVGDGLESLPAPDLSCSAAKKKFIEEFKRQNGDQPRSEILLAAAKADIPDCNPATFCGHGYFLTDQLRFAVQDLSHPYIQAGVEVTKNVLKYLRDKAIATGFSLSVITIPTREYVFYQCKEHLSVRHSNTLEKLAEAENKVINTLRSICGELGLSHTDLTAVLTDNIDKQLYFSGSDDGHLTPEGHKVVAKFLGKTLLEKGSVVSDSFYPLY